ncbi:tryptophan 2,3-dioxygenase [Tropicimonas sediminicola]|uniref:Tryptophan 2,3-dioxygenase (Vermilion) n=1 Tax=Tropicimonas sediminicola TaxID=1031541 RepID=A0A239C558_9RHOB|nr:tryptophan 2,3-dioxygenase [Tropicimonas sediminicola]SNS14554.1 Tryptophan 2,3-dioxygenase (vermilion) [Tropicimonas sediminicola]
MAAFDLWWQDPGAEGFPFGSAVDASHEVGKQFLPEEMIGCLARLREARSRVGGGAEAQRLLDGFLDCALDKHEGRYDYATYCALKVLDFPDDGTGFHDPAGVLEQRDLGLLALMGDLLGFELDALEGRAEILPLMRPGAELGRRRLRLTRAALRPSLDRAGLAIRSDEPEDAARKVLEAIGPRVSQQMRRRLAASMLPVHVVHDEYLFLRVLQGFELSFAWIAVSLRQAIDAMPSAPAASLGWLHLANQLLREVSRLFPLIGSMQPAAFHEFRRYTEGASAIQSAGYKTVEALCRRPDAERLDSPAYRSVPEVQAAVQEGLPTLEDALAAMNEDPEADVALRGEIEAELAAFARQLLRWRQAHYQIARRFLGNRSGTGYTEGLPYLDKGRSVPVFRAASLRET